MTAVHPDARMGPSLVARLCMGKFQASAATTTPTGSRTARNMFFPPAASLMPWVCSLLACSRKKLR